MKSKRVLVYIYFLTSISIMINGYYTYEGISLFLKDINKDVMSIVISNISLNLSWIILYFWFLIKPTQRRDVLLIAVFSMIFANILHNYNSSFEQIGLNLALLSVLLSLYLYAYKLLKTNLVF